MDLWVETPLIHSHEISQKIGCAAYLKLETIQPGYSFKSRGLSHFLRQAKEVHGPGLHAIVASGGNAGIAAACAARVLELRCTVYIPEGVTETTLRFLRGQGAEVVVAGHLYAEALEAARRAVHTEKDAVMVPAYDDPILWEGHSSMITEISRQMPQKPGAIFCSVGGAGLLGGVIVGCKKAGWDDVPIIALETLGSNGFHHSILLNQAATSSFATKLPANVEAVHDEIEGVRLAHFAAFSSKASGSLGASLPSARVVKMALERAGGVTCVSVPDELSMQTAVAFADDHKLLVELACSTTLTAGYKRTLFEKVVPGAAKGSVVFIACGGFKVSLDDIVQYRTLVNEGMKQNPDEAYWQVVYGDGNIVEIPKSIHC